MLPLSPRLILIGAASAAALATAGGLYWKGQHDAGARLKPQLAAARVQDKVDQAAIQAVDHYTDHVTVIHDKAERAADAVQAAPGADAPLPGAVRDAWLGGLRDLAGSPADQRPGDPPR